MPQPLWDLLQSLQPTMSSANAASSSSSGDAHMEAYLARSQTRLHIAQLTEAESQEEKAHAVEGLAKFLVRTPKAANQYRSQRKLTSSMIHSSWVFARKNNSPLYVNFRKQLSALWAQFGKTNGTISAKT